MAAFARSAPAIYRNYFTEGAAESSVETCKGTLRLVGVAPPHVYFEFAIIGYFRHGLELVTGKPVVESCVRGFSKGDRDVLYTYAVG